MRWCRTSAAEYCRYDSLSESLCTGKETCVLMSRPGSVLFLDTDISESVLQALNHPKLGTMNFKNPRKRNQGEEREEREGKKEKRREAKKEVEVEVR